VQTLGSYYRQTWWLWLLFITVLVVLSYKLSSLFIIFIPATLAYSFYFGIVRVAEIRAEEKKDALR
jgi:hypothetical protein